MREQVTQEAPPQWEENDVENRTTSPVSCTKTDAGFVLLERPGMTGIHFIVEALPDGGYAARGVGQDIFTEAESLPVLHTLLRDAVRCHFDEGSEPRLIRLHITREEVLEL
jgi:hypothetical protein